jgi:hypothetical protein
MAHWHAAFNAAWRAAYERSLHRYGGAYSALSDRVIAMGGDRIAPPYFWLGADAERV